MFIITRCIANADAVALRRQTRDQDDWLGQKRRCRSRRSRWRGSLPGLDHVAIADRHQPQRGGERLRPPMLSISRPMIGPTMIPRRVRPDDQPGRREVDVADEQRR